MLSFILLYILPIIILAVVYWYDVRIIGSGYTLKNIIVASLLMFTPILNILVAGAGMVFVFEDAVNLNKVIIKGKKDG